MKKLIVSTIVLLIISNCYGQSEIAFLKLLRNRYATVNTLHATMEVAQSDSPDQQVEVWFDARRSKIVTDDMEMMANASWFVMVDKVNKMINLQERTAGQPSNTAAQSYQLPIDSLLNMSSSIAIDTLAAKSEIALQLALTHPLLKEMTITTDLDLNLKSVYYEISSYTGQLNGMQVRYSTFNTRPKLQEAQFALTQYVQVGNESYEPAAAYVGYQINQIPSAYTN